MADLRKSWIIVTIVLSVLKAVNVQFAMPMHMYQPPPPPMVVMAPPPPPVQVPVGVPFPVPVPILVTRKTTTTTTTTTTESPENSDGDGKFAIAVPLPFGFPMPFAVPQAPPPTFCTNPKRPKQCPPCPPCVCFPSCTPAFYSFCSPCHQKCRCKGNNSVPVPEPPKPPPPVPLPMLPQPMPMPMYPMAPAPPPVFIFPLPPARPYQRLPRRIPSDQIINNERSSSSGSSCSSSSSNSDSDSARRRRRRRRFKIRRPVRSFRRDGKSDEGTVVEKGMLVKPMLSYISKQGEVKFEKQISQDDAARLLRDTDKSNSVEVQRRSANVVKDRRKIVFSPPPNKKITNLTVAFDVV